MRAKFSTILAVLFLLAFASSTFAQWVAQTSGTTQRVRMLKAISSNVIWGCGGAGEVYRTTDGGTTWTKSVTLATVTNYAIEALDANTAWVTGTVGGTANATLWKTTDGGTTWVAQHNNVNGFGDGVKFFDANNGVYYCDPDPYPSKYWEIYTTANGGTTWTRVPKANIPDADSVNQEAGTAGAMAIAGNNVWFTGYSAVAGTKDRIYKSTDKGLTWTVKEITPVSGTSGSNYIAMADVNNGVVVALDGTTARTTDGGNNWITSSVTGAGFRFVTNIKGTNKYLAVGNNGLSWVSADAGATWTALPALNTNSLYGVTEFNGSIWASGNTGTILKWNGPLEPMTTVTFRVDMGAQVFKGLFNKTTDSLCVRGGFQADAGDPGGNWQGYKFKMTDPDGDTIYTATATFPASLPDTNKYEFKFVKNNDGWEASPNRIFTLGGTNQTLPVYWFNNDSVYKIIVTVTNTLKFTADLRTILGTGTGYFDPNQDSMQVMGLDWDGLGTLISGNRKVVEDPLSPGRYKTTLTISGPLGDSTKWKFRAFPETRFTNTGWETGEDRWFKYVANNTTVTLPTIVPRIFPTIGPIPTAVNVLFQVDMSKNPKNKYNQQLIPVNQIKFVGVKGGSVPIGNWGGNWVAADTTAGQLIVLNDAGVMGDLVPGDKVYSKLINFPAATPGGAIEFKFACQYPGSDTVNGGASPLDNEGGFGVNHMFTLRSGGQISLKNTWGDFTTEVRENANILPGSFELFQNYPNPFNPSTKISYRVAKEGFVTLKIFNVMGEEVGTLFSGVQKAGGYDVSFDASKLTSGMYLYSLQADGFSATRKMMLVK